MNEFDLDAYAYTLPEELIAKKPPAKRGESRLMLLGRHGDSPPQDEMFADLAKFLPDGALLVANNSRVFPARLYGLRNSGGKVEFLLLTPLDLLRKEAQKGTDGFFAAQAECLFRCGGRIAKNEEIRFSENLFVQSLERGEFGRHSIKIFWKGDLEKIFATGEIPLPPYLKRKAENWDAERYQTIYAKTAGSVAAPTAGLHFTREMKTRLLEQGFGWTEITLHVGYGTFSPVRSQDIRAHQMHAEYAEISPETAGLISEAHSAGRPIIAIGTTSLRALEGVFKKNGAMTEYSGWLNIFFYPGKKFGIVDGLLTNFHLPCSTLLMLAAAFCGRERILAAYRHAVLKKYRFFSYGDAMLIT